MRDTPLCPANRAFSPCVCRAHKYVQRDPPSVFSAMRPPPPPRDRPKSHARRRRQNAALPCCCPARPQAHNAPQNGAPQNRYRSRCQSPSACLPEAVRTYTVEVQGAQNAQPGEGIPGRGLSRPLRQCVRPAQRGGGSRVVVWRDSPPAALRASARRAHAAASSGMPLRGARSAARMRCTRQRGGAREVAFTRVRQRSVRVPRATPGIRPPRLKPV